jgi:Xaa-Pro aminopeptidase
MTGFAYRERVAALRRAMEGEGLAALAVTSAANRRYLTGFTGSAGIAWITPTDAALVVDSRYWEQAEAEAAPAGFRVVRQGPDGPVPVLQRLAAGPFGFERDHVSYGQVEAWRGAGLRPVPAPPLVDRMRWVKDPAELALIRRAVAVAEEALARVLPLVRPGVLEAELALELEFRMRRLGAEGVSFPPIVASGPRGALPHGRASDRRIGAGELVTLDFGAVVGGYASDVTRTFAVGQPPPEARALYAVVRRALEAGVAALRPGVRGTDVDAAARAVIDAAGHGPHFGHGLGHGVGLAAHEGPRLSRNAPDDVVPSGAVVTVEPGVYLPGWGGIRLEDMVLVGPGGAERLTRAPEELQVLGG